MTDPVLSVEHLTVDLVTADGMIRPVDDVSFTIAPGGTLGLVGESGCGKSVTAMSVTRLLPRATATIAPHSRVVFDGQDLVAMSDRTLRSIRGKRIGTIFQEPMTALNPAFTIGDQITEPLRLHLGLGRKAARAKALDLLAMVGIPRPERVVADYPHQLSGGMRQRVMIAMAMGCEPDLLIADEPTTALDVTTQAQILDLMLDLQQTHGTALLLITHDLGVVAQTCQDVVVMYAGSVVEQATIHDVFAEPSHPYTQGLMRSLPANNVGHVRLPSIPGTVPALTDLPPACRFEPRCAYAVGACRDGLPALVPTSRGSDGHAARCVRLGDLTVTRPGLTGAPSSAPDQGATAVDVPPEGDA